MRQTCALTQEPRVNRVELAYNEPIVTISDSPNEECLVTILDQAPDADRVPVHLELRLVSRVDASRLGRQMATAAALPSDETARNKVVATMRSALRCLARARDVQRAKQLVVDAQMIARDRPELDAIWDLLWQCVLEAAPGRDEFVALCRAEYVARHDAAAA